MTKNIIKSVAISLVFIPMVTFASPAPSSSPASSPASSPQASAPATVSSASTASNVPSGSNSSSSVAPASINSSATVSNTPSSTGSTVTTAPASINSSSTAGKPATTTTPTATPTPAPVVPTNGNSSSGGNSSSSGSQVGTYGMYGCPMITSFMKYGANNDTLQVTKLQTFLKNVEKINVDVTGIFDKKTEQAVIAFQNKYSATTMGPWGASQGTGYVYITTVKQINKIACALPLSLNPQELATINAGKKVKSNASVIVTPKKDSGSIKVDMRNEDNTITLTSTPEANTENTATVQKASIMNRFWNFLVYLFK